jgi:hypothetical protein
MEIEAQYVNCSFSVGTPISPIVLISSGYLKPMTCMHKITTRHTHTRVHNLQSLIPVHTNTLMRAHTHILMLTHNCTCLQIEGSGRSSSISSRQDSCRSLPEGGSEATARAKAPLIFLRQLDQLLLSCYSCIFDT